MDNSKTLSDCLDRLGYSQEMIEYRRKSSKYMDALFNSKPFELRHFTVGAKAEGTALYFESDIDRLFEVKGVKCVEPGTSCKTAVVFHLDRNGCSPGYTRLKLYAIHRFFQRVIEKYCVTENSAVVMTNTYRPLDETNIYIDINGMPLNKQETNGPASPFGNAYISYDFVVGFKCSCKYLISKWVARQRKYNWPDQILIERISRMEGHVVPVANKGSRYPTTEWRICFTNVEIALVRTFTNIQVKLYIILKLVAKSVLRPICVEMSSYVMKDIVLWMVEINPPEAFLQPLMIDRLVDALVFLKDCLLTNNLPSYMIEDRNLFERRISESEKTKLLKVLEILICEKENMLERCNKLKIGLNRLKICSDDFKREGDKRNEIEKLILKQNVIFKDVDSPFVQQDNIQTRLQNNELYQIYKSKLHNLILYDKVVIEEQRRDVEEVYRSRLVALLS